MSQQYEFDKCVRQWWLALFAGVIAAPGCLSPAEPRLGRALSETEMEVVQGGVAANITAPSSGSVSTFDNIRFTASMSSTGATSGVFVGLFAGATKVSEQTMNLPGTWDRRARWPFPGAHSGQFKFLVDDEWFDASGDSLRTNVKLAPNVHVYGVRLRSLNAGVNSTTISSLAAERIDATSPASQTSASNTIDGIYGQCGGSNITQWRHINSGSINSTAACSDLSALTDACPVATCSAQQWELCPPLMDCLHDVFYSEAVQTTDAYVFHVKSVPCGKSGQNLALFPPGNGPRRSFVLLDADIETNPTTYTALLAHELGHDFNAAHCNGPNPDDQCAPSDCPGNVMCDPVGGRALTSGQCAAYAAGLRWTDLND